MMSTRVRMTIEWLVPIGQTRPITMALHSVAAETRGSHGCVSCSVETDISNRGTVRYCESWLTEEDLRERVRSDTFGHIMALMENSSDPPRIEFKLGDHTRGLDYLDEAREPIS